MSEDPYRVPGLVIFNKENDDSDYCLDLRQQFERHMLRITGSRRPEPDLALEAHKKWLKYVTQQLEGLQRATVTSLKHGVRHELKMRGIDSEGMENLGLYSHFGEHNFMFPFIRPHFFDLNDCFATSFSDGVGGSTKYIWIDESDQDLTSYFKSTGYTPVRIHISTKEVLQKLENGIDLSLALDLVAKDILAHEILHLAANFGSEESSENKRGSYSGLHGPTDTGEELSLWGNEGLIEFTTLIAYPNRIVRYIDATFVFALIDQIDSDFWPAALAMGYGSFQGATVSRLFDQMARAVLKNHLGEDYVKQLFNYLNDSCKSDCEIEPMRRIEVMGKLLKKCAESDALTKAAVEADQKLNQIFSVALISGMGNVSPSFRVPFLPKKINSRVSNLISRPIDFCMQKMHKRLDSNFRAIYKIFPEHMHESDSQYDARKNRKWRSYKYALVGVYGISAGLILGDTHHEREVNHCLKENAAKLFDSAQPVGPDAFVPLDALAEGTHVFRLPNGKVVKTTPLQDPRQTTSTSAVPLLPGFNPNPIESALDPGRVVPALVPSEQICR